MCVPGAHNCIVTSRAGKDLVSCLVSGLLTIGPRFGGAIDDAARFFQARTPWGASSSPCKSLPSGCRLCTSAVQWAFSGCKNKYGLGA